MTDRTYPYYLVRTAFHGGGVVSRHWTREGAEKAQERARYLRSKTCRCGCVVVVEAENYRYLPHAADAPDERVAARK